MFKEPFKEMMAIRRKNLVFLPSLARKRKILPEHLQSWSNLEQTRLREQTIVN